MNTKGTRQFKAYLSEPITRCPIRERGRIQRLVDQLKDVLKKEPYSTQLYIPSLVSDPVVRKNLSPEHVYLLDRIRIVEADYLLVLADHTSFGVGGEVEMATNLGKPIILFSRDKKLSRFLLGTPANALLALHSAVAVPAKNSYYIHYKEWRDLRQPLLSWVSKVLEHLECTLDQPPFWDISTRLKSIRVQRGLSPAELAERAGILLPQLLIWEKSLNEIVMDLQAYQKAGQLDLDPIELNSTQLEQLSNPSLSALHRLSSALEVPVSALLGDPTEKLVSKGPAKYNQLLTNQVMRSREEALEARSFQFDVTFREYRLLKKKFITEFLASIEGSESFHSIHLGRISEEEFHEELMALRLIPPAKSRSQRTST
jgi:transcriptional regulator with XRE-family HTH domain